MSDYTTRVLKLTSEESEALSDLLRHYSEMVEEDPALEAVKAKLDADPMEGWEPGRWWTVWNPDESIVDPRLRLWCETSDEGEARVALAKRPGYILTREWRFQARQWRITP